MTDKVLVRQRSRPARSLDVEGAEGSITVSRSAYGIASDTQEKIRVPIFHTTPARVRVSGSVTRNLGDYNSARVEVSIELPCYPEQSEVQRTYDYISGLLDTMIPAELAKAAGDGTNG
jgi:hypothetical protein